MRDEQPNNSIKLTAHPVTQLACASCVTVWPATYRLRWAVWDTDLNESAADRTLLAGPH
jgi:hypothetical protein